MRTQWLFGASRQGLAENGDCVLVALKPGGAKALGLTLAGRFNGFVPRVGAF
jgi:hypothetical protein